MRTLHFVKEKIYDGPEEWKSQVPANSRTSLAGFISAVTTQKESVVAGANRYALYRIRPGQMTGESLLRRIETGGER